MYFTKLELDQINAILFQTLKLLVFIPSPLPLLTTLTTNLLVDLRRLQPQISSTSFLWPVESGCAKGL